MKERGRESGERVGVIYFWAEKIFGFGTPSSRLKNCFRRRMSVREGTRQRTCRRSAILGVPCVRTADGGWKGAPRAFLLHPPDARGDCRLAYLRRTKSASGSRVLGVVERLGRREDTGCKRITLQDAARKVCSRGSSSSSSSSPAYDLGFRERLLTGKTWYEQRGYARASDDGRASAANKKHMAAFAAVPVADVLAAVALQNARMAAAATDAAKKLAPVRGAFWGDDALELAPLPALRRTRRRLERLLSRAFEPRRPASPTLGTWLPRLPCADYAFFMRAMYGEMHSARNTMALRRAFGVATPSVKEFVAANQQRRWSHKITWTKRL
jgi:hypothetical protein